MLEEDEGSDSTLILAAEECPSDIFHKIHKFSLSDDVIIRKLVAHGPVLLRGGRGSGKSALLLEAHSRMRELDHIFSVYVSLRYLPLLQSDGDEYIAYFCSLVSRIIQNTLIEAEIGIDFPTATDQRDFIDAVIELSKTLEKRVVLLFDDAAHIGREKPLTVFFDLFRTLSTSAVSCKASIYPGVTKFGIRFDVYNDSTVVDVSRTEVGDESTQFFAAVVAARYPKLSVNSLFSERMSPESFASLLGRAVIGNMRAFVFACTKFNEKSRIGLNEIRECFLDMSSNYYWPLMDEVAPKLGVYEPMIEPAQQIAEIIVDNVIRTSKHGIRPTPQDRVLIHKQIVGQFSKPFEILEYLGFLNKREASRALKSGGRGSVYALNLCTLVEKIPGGRITADDVREWTTSAGEASEIHVTTPLFTAITLPAIPADHDLSILDKEIEVLKQSRAYPYGLTDNKLSKLRGAGIERVGQLAAANETLLRSIDTIGPKSLDRIRNVVNQAIWM